MSQRSRAVFLISVLTCIACGGNRPTEEQLPDGSYGGDLEFLRAHVADIVELTDATGQARIAVSAKYQGRSEEHTSELQSRENLVCRLLLAKKTRRPRGPQRGTRAP